MRISLCNLCVLCVCSENKTLLQAHKTLVSYFAEEQRIDRRPINQSVPRLSEGRSSNEMVTDDIIFLKIHFHVRWCASGACLTLWLRIARENNHRERRERRERRGCAEKNAGHDKAGEKS